MRLLIQNVWKLCALLLMMVSCSSGQGPSAEKNGLGKDGRVLIVYLSRTQNTRALAEIIHEKVGGELVTLEPAIPYPENYRRAVSQVANENATGYLPPLKTRIDSIEKYEVIFIGFPTWGMQLPPPVKSFLNQYNLSGKTLIPFNTNAGYGVGSSFDNVKELASRSTVLEGYSTKGGVERDGILFVMEGGKEKQVREEVEDWLSKIGWAK